MSVPRDAVIDILDRLEAQEAADMPTNEEVMDYLDGPVVPPDPDPPYISGRDPLPPEEEPQEAQPLSEREILGILENELSQSVGGRDDDDLTGSLALAYEYYHGREPKQPKSGRSKVISMDLADMVEALLAEILPTFLQDLSVEFESDAEQDEETAQEESALCSKVVMRDNRGYTLWYELIKAALLEKNCVAKVYPEERDHFVRERHNGLNVMAVAQLLQPTKPGEVVEIEERTLSQTQPPPQSPDPRVQQLPQQGPLFDITLRRTNTVKKIRIKAVPMSEIRIRGDHNSVSLRECPFICHERLETASDLIKDGYDPELVDQLPDATDDANSLKRANSQTSSETDTFASHLATRKVLVRENWVEIDEDGDGIAELRKIVTGGENQLILEDVEESGNLFASGTAFIMPKRWLGLSLYDKLKEIQDSKTDFLRQAHDNAKTGTHNTIGYVVGQVKADDLFNRKPGGGVRMKRRDSIVPIPHTDVLPSIFTMLGYQDKMRTERGGAALDMHSEQLPVPGDTAHGAERMMTSKEMLSAMITNTIAETVVCDVYLHVHRLLRESFRGDQSFKVGARWIKTDPSVWPARTGVTATVGKSHGERMRQQGVLGQVLQYQEKALATFGPGVLVDVEKTHNALCDYVKMAGIANTDQYWVDPSTPESKQAAAIHQQTQEQAQQQAREQNQMLLAMQERLSMAIEETKRLKIAMDRQTSQEKLAEDQRQHTEDTATEITQMELEHAKDVSEQRIQNREG